MAKTDLTAQRLRELLNYNPETGEFKWVSPTSNRCVAGKTAGNKSAIGYVSIRIDKTRHYAHRLAWLYMTGDWPQEFIDHCNRIKADNRFENLRQVNSFGNMQNVARMPKKYPVGVKPSETAGKYRARIIANKKQYDLGTFQTIDLAREAREVAASVLHIKKL